MRGWIESSGIEDGRAPWWDSIGKDGAGEMGNVFVGGLLG